MGIGWSIYKKYIILDIESNMEIYIKNLFAIPPSLMGVEVSMYNFSFLKLSKYPDLDIKKYIHQTPIPIGLRGNGG